MSRKLATAAAFTALLTAPLCMAGQLDSLPPARWFVFPNSKLDSVAASFRTPALVYAWGSGIYDTDRERLVVWGGGHNDYDGNELYAFGPLTSDTPQWTRLLEPSAPAANNVARGGDGRPVSRHTYNLLAYLPAPFNKMMSCAIGARHSDGNAMPGVDFYDFTIDGRKGQPWSPGPTAPFNGFPGGFCIYNSLTQSVWYQPTGGSSPNLQEYQPATNSWTVHAEVREERDPTPAIDTRRNLMVTAGKEFSGSGSGLLLYDLSRPKDKAIKIKSVGPKAIETARFPGFVYDSVNDQFVGWSGGSAIYTLKVPTDPKTGTWVWAQLQLDPGNTVIPTPIAGPRQAGYDIGTFGRFRYVASQRGVIVVNATDEPVFFFKLPTGNSSLLPSVTISADPTLVSVSGTSTLTWSTTNATACNASGAWSGVKATAGTEARGPLNGSSNFILTCDNGTGGVGSGAVTVSTAQAIPAPTVDLNATPAALDASGPVTLGWTSTGAAGCVASGGWSGAKAVSGSQNVTVTQETSYVLTCSGQGGTSSDAITVRFGTAVPGDPKAAAPKLMLSASAGAVASGSNLMLSWNSSDATGCVASNAWSGAKAVNGSQLVTPTQNSTYVLTCSGANGSVERNVTVTVSLTTTPDAAPSGGTKRKGGGGGVDLLTLLLLAMAVLWRNRQAVRKSWLAMWVGVLAMAGSSAQAADLTTVILQSQSTSTQGEVPFTFGQVFKLGEVPAQMGLKARLSDGSSVPLQVDAKATYADGSLRHAVLTGRLSSLAVSSNQLMTLSTGPLTTGAPIALSSVLGSGYDTSVSLNLGGTVYTASARQALLGSNLKTWLAGPMVSEWIAGTPVKTAGGVPHPHLTAYFHVRAYAGSTQVRTDVVLENNWALVAGPGNFGYTATVSVPGKTDYVKTLTHYSRTRWHKRFWWGTEPRVYVKLDKTYLQDTKAIPKYENVTPTERYLNSVRRSTEPMSNGDQEPDMEATGYQDGIGPLPQWDAVYAVSTDVRAFDFMLANADGGTAYSIHIRDEKTGLPISIDNFPNTSLADTNNSSPQLPEGGGSPFTVVWAGHQPSIGYLPYVVTGDYFYLEEMQLWSAYNLIWPNKEDRSRTKGWWYTGSIRGQAWAYRSLAQAAFITPDAHPLKAYLLEKLSNNIKRDIELYVSPGGPHKNNLGAMNSYNGNKEYLFFDYFMSWVVQYLVELGYNEVIPFRDYKLKFPIGIMGSGADQYCFQAAARYLWDVGPPGFDTFYPDFKTMFAKTVPGANPAACGTQAMTTFLGKLEPNLVGPNAMIGEQRSTGYYFANLQPALAAAYDSGVAGGKLAWERSQASGAHANYADNPIFGIMPRALGGGTISVSIAANPATVAPGGSSTLNWTSNAESCMASGDWAGNKPTAGSQALSGLQSNQSYVLTCSSNSLGTQASTAVVTVVKAGAGDAPGEKPTVSLSTSTSVQSGQTATLVWSSSNATSCVASGGWSGGKALNGMEAVGPLSSSTSFSLGCSGTGGMQIATMNVMVVAATATSPEPVKKKGGGGGAMDLSTLLLLLGAAAARHLFVRIRRQGC